MRRSLQKTAGIVVSRAVDVAKQNKEARFLDLASFVNTFNLKNMATEILNKPGLKIALTDAERQSAIAMLVKHDLPTADMDDDKLLYVLIKEEKIIGTAGLEIFDDCAMLRSVSVAKEEQGQGYGKIINDEIEKFAKESGINCMYLLTTTAKDFFDKQGYCVIKREETPEAIKQTAEFSSLCPASAVLMKKKV